jgi:DNA-binding response OmpR family regulator
VRRIRQTQEELAKIAVIVTSASVFDADQAASIAAGADDFLPKPVQMDELLDKLQKHLGLEYLREAATSERTGSAPLSSAPAAVTPPSKEDLALLFDLVERGRIPRLLEEANRIEQMDARFSAFAGQLRSLARTFDETALRDLIAQHMNA